jgi:hypothetical protein
MSQARLVRVESLPTRGSRLFSIFLAAGRVNRVDLCGFAVRILCGFAVRIFGAVRNNLCIGRALLASAGSGNRPEPFHPLKTNPEYRHQSLQDGRQANQNYKDFEQICQSTIARKPIDQIEK